jgi:hypothetical protein
MKANIEIWTVQELYDLLDDINSQPKYQRGPAWNENKKSLLIDSMLRGIDIPKVYLNKKKSGSFKYEVADGQQRIDAIKSFKDDELELRDDSMWGLNLNRIDSVDVGGQSYSTLDKKLRQRFDKYSLTIAIVEDATPHEIRTLFGRLQLGEKLNPAEKRNALISSAGAHIDSIARMHKFFTHSKIGEERYNHQDYLSHAFALVAYRNSEDLKATLLEKMYLDRSIKWSAEEVKKITDVLDIMFEIDRNSKKRISNKFSFIDIFWFLYDEFDSYKRVDYKKFASFYDTFEQNRLANYKESKELLATKKKSDSDLFSYIMAYRYDGAKSLSIEKRATVIRKQFKKFLI